MCCDGPSGYYLHGIAVKARTGHCLLTTPRARAMVIHSLLCAAVIANTALHRQVLVPPAATSSVQKFSQRAYGVCWAIMVHVEQPSKMR